MQIKPFVFNSFQVNTFVLYDDSKECIIIDPACYALEEYNELYKFIGDNGLMPKYIANTHGHVDHLLGVKTVSEHYNIPFKVHEDDFFLLETAVQSGLIFGFNINENPVADEILKEGEIIKFGNSELELFHVPGHSPGSIVFYSKEGAFVVVGDVLFKSSIGRTDLPGGNYEDLISGIRSKLLTLPPETIVLSGHGPHTTIKNEHDTNPFLT
ncbi:MAG: MBL fold metallo-hydrolase [Bacteroidales bacterium]|nr:MBL fold metallo-hydrolase [Bacteroidales bacterium]MBN2819151.1 MBL fold metallo-hydrolase [Bacteroidales bacterium]